MNEKGFKELERLNEKEYEDAKKTARKKCRNELQLAYEKYEKKFFELDRKLKRLRERS